MSLPDALYITRFVHSVWWEQKMSFGNCLIFHFPEGFSWALGNLLSYICRSILSQRRPLCISTKCPLLCSSSLLDFLSHWLQLFYLELPYLSPNLSENFWLCLGTFPVLQPRNFLQVVSCRIVGLAFVVSLYLGILLLYCLFSNVRKTLYRIFCSYVLLV